MSNTVLACKTEDFQLDMEVLDERVFVHCSVDNNSPSTIKEIQYAWKELKEELFLAGFDFVYSYTPNEKFAKAIDSSYENMASVSHQGKDYEVLRWDLR